MKALRTASFATLALVASGAAACSSATSPGPAGSGGAGGAAGGGAGAAGGKSAIANVSGSEVSVSVVSGALNNNSKSDVAYLLKKKKSSAFDRALSFINPVGTAHAATWSCSGESLSPAFAGPGTYAFTPPSCSVTWADDKTGTSSWNDAFSLVYGSGCSSKSSFMETQAASCEMTRTSGGDGDTRTITGPDGNTYSITHDTNGAGTGWDTSVSPAPTDDGVVVTCGGAGCASTRSLDIHGSHITGVVDIDKDTVKIWDHTVTASEIAVANAGPSRTVSGVVTVQHNLLKYTSTTTFTDVGYAVPGCCFPTSGSVSTTYTAGSETGKTERLVFSAVCGESILTDVSGKTGALTLAHCL